MRNPEPAERGSVLAFPARPQPVPPPAAQARLERALAGLATALAGQQQATAQWRAALGDLRDSVTHLSGSMTDYRLRLDYLRTDLACLYAQAKELETLAGRLGG
jgi:uncharacterized coiled-coil protein SlyX